MFEWIVKKVVCGKINDLLKRHEGGAAQTRETLKTWTERTKKTLACFESLLAKLDDNELDSDELKAAADEVTALIKGW